MPLRDDALTDLSALVAPLSDEELAAALSLIQMAISFPEGGLLGAARRIALTLFSDAAGGGG